MLNICERFSNKNRFLFNASKSQLICFSKNDDPMHDRRHILDSHSLIHDRQFGFRNNHSTTHAIITLVNTITESVDSGGVVAVIHCLQVYCYYYL